jgi:hypothetical protein
VGVVWLCGLAPVAAQHHPSGLPHGIPNFCAAPTITSVGSGSWSTPSVWSPAREPGAADVVVIGGGSAVTLAAQGTVRALCIDGQLQFRNDVSTRLTVGTLVVRPSGALEVGTASAPIAPGVVAEIVIANQAIDTRADPEQFGTGLIGQGRVIMHGAVKNPTFVRLSQEAVAGQNSLQLTEAVSGWRNGDKLVLPDSKQWAIDSVPYTEEWEEPILSAVSGAALTLSAGLSFNHPGARSGNNQLEFLPHVGNLSRNVIVRSEAPAGARGHVLFNNRANVDIRYVLFKDLGRTSIQALNSATFNGNTPTQIGMNQVGRYSLHMHHLFGPEATPANGYQYTLIGNAIDNGTKWGITIHNSHYGLVKDNVVYNAAGAGVMTEDGSESFNVFEHNFVVRSRGTGEERGDSRNIWLDSGYEGVGFWFRGPNNYVRQNVAANSNSYAFAIYPLDLTQARVPKHKGADTSVDGHYDVINMQATPVLEFVQNEGYASVSGLTIWDVGADCCAVVYEVPESVVRDMRLWHVSRYGYYGYAHNRVTFDGWVQRGDQSLLANGREFSLGLWFGDYPTRNLIIRNSDIQGIRIGVLAPYKPGDTSDIYGNQPGTMRIENSYIRTHYGVLMRPMYGVTGGGTSLPPRRTFIDNVRFDSVNGNVGGNPQYTVAMHFQIDTRNANIVQTDQVFVTNYNGVAGANYQVFYGEQAPNYVVPQSTTGVVGAPTAGLTNLQTWATYGIAIAGAIAPCQTSVPGIAGFACAGTFTPPSPPRNLRIVSQD